MHCPAEPMCEYSRWSCGESTTSGCVCRALTLPHSTQAPPLTQIKQRISSSEKTSDTDNLLSSAVSVKRLFRTNPGHCPQSMCENALSLAAEELRLILIQSCELWRLLPLGFLPQREVLWTPFLEFVSPPTTWKKSQIRHETVAWSWYILLCLTFSKSEELLAIGYQPPFHNTNKSWMWQVFSNWFGFCPHSWQNTQRIS